MISEENLKKIAPDGASEECLSLKTSEIQIWGEKPMLHKLPMPQQQTTLNTCTCLLPLTAKHSAAGKNSVRHQGRCDQ